MLMSLLLLGLEINTLWTAIVAVAVLGLLNALLWPLLTYLLLPFAVFTLGFFSLLLNGVMVWLTGEFVSSVTVDTIWTAIMCPY